MIWITSSMRITNSIGITNSIRIHLIPEIITCYDQYYQSGHTYILRHLDSDFNEMQCVTYYPTDNEAILLERELDAGTTTLGWITWFKYSRDTCAVVMLDNHDLM